MSLTKQSQVAKYSNGIRSRGFQKRNQVAERNRVLKKFEISWLEDKSDEGVLNEIRRVKAMDPSRRLTVERFNSLSKIKSSAVAERFGSFGEATRKAGLQDALPIYSKDAILADLQRVSSLTENKPFTIAMYKQCGKYSETTIKRLFGGWRKALEHAGLGHRYVGTVITERMRSQPGRAMTDEEIFKQIRDVAERLGKTSLSGAEIQANSNVTQSKMNRRIGSVSAALKHAGVEQVNHGLRYTEDEIFENLLNVWEHYGRAPTVAEMDKPPSTVGKNTYLHRYGGWRKALKLLVGRANSEAERESSVNSQAALQNHTALGDVPIGQADSISPKTESQSIIEVSRIKSGKKKLKQR